MLTTISQELSNESISVRALSNLKMVFIKQFGRVIGLHSKTHRVVTELNY